MNTNGFKIDNFPDSWKDEAVHQVDISLPNKTEDEILPPFRTSVTVNNAFINKISTNNRKEILQELESEGLESITQWQEAFDFGKDFNLERWPIVYNTKEYGINESELSVEKQKVLKQIRLFAHDASEIYAGATRALMTGYQKKNPRFTDEIIKKMMEYGYDVPEFSIYGLQAAQEFLAQLPKIDTNGIKMNFLVNFQLPKPIARFWYKSGELEEEQIQWGYFYNMVMPIIYEAVEYAHRSGLYLDRINTIGQHDSKKYYYLYVVDGLFF